MTIEHESSQSEYKVYLFTAVGVTAYHYPDDPYVSSGKIKDYSRHKDPEVLVSRTISPSSV